MFKDVTVWIEASLVVGLLTLPMTTVHRGWVVTDTQVMEAVIYIEGWHPPLVLPPTCLDCGLEWEGSGRHPCPSAVEVGFHVDEMD